MYCRSSNTYGGAAGYAIAAETGAFATANIHQTVTDGESNYLRDTVFGGNQGAYDTANTIMDLAGMTYITAGATTGKAGKAGTTGKKQGGSVTEVKR